AGSEWFTIIDLDAAFWQISLEEASRKYTAFMTEVGVYEFCVMPMGLSTSPAVMQRLMDSILTPHRKYTKGFVDDIAIHSRTLPEDLMHIRVVLCTLVEHKLAISFEKSKFAQREIRYLGYKISGKGIEPDSKTIVAIRDFPTPNNKELTPQKRVSALLS